MESKEFTVEVLKVISEVLAEMNKNPPVGAIPFLHGYRKGTIEAKMIVDEAIKELQ